MKAIFRWGVGLVGLLLAAAVSHAYVWVTPVFKTPYPQAPSPSNMAYYVMDAYGRWSGPHYYVVPPCQPFNGLLPGKTGEMIMQGYLPHTQLLSKEGLSIGKVPLVDDKPAENGASQAAKMPGAGLPDLNAQRGYNPNAGMMPPSNMQVPYGMPRANPMPMPYGNMQMPYGQRPAPLPYPMPYGGGPMPYPMPYGGAPMPYGGMPAPMPYGGGPMPYGAMPYPNQGPMPMMPGGRPLVWRDPATNIYLAQNVIPNFTPTMPGAPVMPMMPGMPATPMMPGMPATPMMPGGPMTPMMPLGPSDTFQYFQPFSPMQGPMPPQMEYQGMQAPQMDMPAPPQQKVGGNAFPMHPFTRSPRDFFMWGESMEDEERMRTRPFPVPR